mmetsp:Transcript_12072/g.14650  ORF Transcript_12072/g.14650 Transcript_12072/m.14650 type:complete len:255 (-) Transcript_12072:536-1300(-)
MEKTLAATSFILVAVCIRIRRETQKQLGVDFARSLTKQLRSISSKTSRIEEGKRKSENIYLLVRHGESLANVEGIISGDPDVGTKKHGLSAKGKEQAREAAGKLHQFLGTRSLELKKVFIRSSPFLRAKETAQILHQELQVPNELVVTADIRERCFGSLEGQSNTRYNDVWKFDYNSAYHKEFMCESVVEVAERAFKTVIDFEKEHSGDVCVIVAHGDLLQILRTTLEMKLPPSRHRFTPHLATASLTKLEPKF